MEWPVCSPDFNLIENLWGILSRKIYENGVANRSPNEECTVTLDYIKKYIGNDAKDLHLFSVDLFYIDITMAFDKLSLVRLIKKEESYGIFGDNSKWLEDFLHSKRQQVILGDYLSNWLPVISGVSQGSALGPVVF
ncbi:uncharacterized protein LOC136091710 [Hydra vulgaris]|uniref:Uncharacterized protein LOC136091710 n=1 Tax=Hydra vulgaris TaxID=6087 RepID=A0ABM4DLR5_HYDVU